MAQLSAEQIRDQFGFSFNEDHAKTAGAWDWDVDHGGRSDGAIFNRETGDYIGTINNFSPKDDSGYASGISQFEAVQDYGIEHGLSHKRKKWNSMNDVSGAVNDILMQKAEAPEQEAPKEPFEPVGKSDDHKTAEANYDKHFQNGNPWDTTSAVDSYQSAFDRVAAAGREMNAGEYLRQRADDKKGGVNRFTHYLTDHNTLASHESHRASMNAIKKAGHVGLEPPALIDPDDLYNKYKGDIDSIGD